MTKITKITIGRTIPMANYANEKQEVEVMLSEDPGKTLEQKIQEARQEVEKTFLLIYPRYGVIQNKEYITYMTKVKESIYPKNEPDKVESAPEGNIPPETNKSKNIIGDNQPQNPSTEMPEIKVNTIKPKF
jgi:hypothetical protein